MNLEVFLPFRDLAGQETQRIGATSIVTPVAGIDYQINTLEDGSGSDVSSNSLITVTFTLGGLRTLPSGEVLSPAGGVVPGLYAAGRTTSGLSAQSCAGSGACIAWFSR